MRTSAEYDASAAGMRIPLGTGVTGRCAASGEVQRIPDVRADPDYIPGVPGALSEVALPLTARGRVIGVLNAEARAVGAFDEGHVRTLAVIAQQVAAVLEATRLRKETERLAITDGLTGLYNRRYFQDRLSQAVELSRRHKERLAVVIVDIDHFKSVNDTYGHPMGDRVLQAFSASLRGSLRRSDLAARFGGEEFAVLLHRAGTRGALTVAGQLRERAEATRVEGPSGEAIAVTVSIGVACFPRHAETPDGLVERADDALYRAKERGRNRVVLAESIGR
jgi:two-component system cell cycle response regulator